MARSLLDRWTDVADLQLLGYSPRAWALGMGAILGDDYPGAGGSGSGGVHLLYRGEDSASAIDYTAPVGIALPGTTLRETIRNYAGYPFAAGTVYWLAVRAVSPGGVEETTGTPPVRIETDGAAAPLPKTPNPPTRLRVFPKPAGYLLVQWEHNARGEQTPVKRANIYSDGGSGSLDLVTPLAHVRGLFYLAGPYADGTIVQFCVRHESAAGDEETNTNTASGTADADGPADIGAATVTTGAES